VLAGTQAGEPVVLHAPGRVLEQGAVYLVRGRLQPLSAEVAGYYAIQGARFELRAVDLVQIGRRGGVWGAVDSVHRWMLTRLGAARSPPAQRALVAGIAIGESGALPAQTRDQLRASGLYHLVAVSGQNVALLLMFVLIVLGAAGVVGVPARAAALALVCGYVLVTGAGPSIVRAGVAGGLVCAAWLVSRPAARWHLLAVGAVCVLAPDPLELWDPGFQLSFAAVVAIIAVAPRIAGWFGQTVAVSVACSLVTAPIVWWDFGRISIWSVPANLLVAVVVAPILWLALAAMLLGALWPPLAGPPLALADLLSAYLLWVARACS
jgi:competence protein ComEC